MTSPGVHSSPGFPPLDAAAQSAIQAARSRLGAFTGQQFPLLVKPLTGQEKDEALKSAADSLCQMCGGVHPAPNTPACPRLATFKLNPDGRIVEGTFWPDGAAESVISMDAEGNVVSVTHRVRSDWDTTRIVHAADLAEEEDSEHHDAPVT